jgi:hypothetical protein
VDSEERRYLFGRLRVLHFVAPRVEFCRMEFIEQRKDPRYPVWISSSVSVGGDAPVEATVIEMSAGGCLLHLPEAVAAETPVAITVEESGRRVLLTGVVAGVLTTTNLVRVRFEEETYEEARALLSLIVNGSELQPPTEVA